MQRRGTMAGERGVIGGGVLVPMFLRKFRWEVEVGVGAEWCLVYCDWLDSEK
jgi:hypothetical protein